MATKRRSIFPILHDDLSVGMHMRYGRDGRDSVLVCIENQRVATVVIRGEESREVARKLDEELPEKGKFSFLAKWIKAAYDALLPE